MKVQGTHDSSSCARGLSAVTMKKKETHVSTRGGWLRAAVLGADDGVVSTSSLMIGVAATSASTGAILVAGIAGLVAGAMSMAAGEFVSVSSQRDAELADVKRERRELAEDPQAELRELANIYEERGLDEDLALKVAMKLSEHNVLGAHLRDELGFDPRMRARPVQAALVSAGSFASLAAIPIVALLLSPAPLRLHVIAVASLVSLAGLGAAGAKLGGASMTRGALRVMLGGGLAMATTAAIGHALHVAGVG